MVDQVIAGVSHSFVGGLAANLLVIFSLASVAMGGQGSHVSRDRRLPGDSDSEVFTLLFAAGAVIGLIVAVAIGGRALREPLRSRIPYTTHGDGLSHLAAFARTLQPRPNPPRRGRPRKNVG